LTRRAAPLPPAAGAATILLAIAANLRRQSGVTSAGGREIDELPSGLVDRMRRAQPEARAEFFRRYAPQARRILFLQGLCDEVDDAVQEVFIKVFRADLPDERRFLAWFYQLILNTGRDQGRRRKTRRGLVERLEGLAVTAQRTEDEGVAPDPAMQLAAVDPALRVALDGLAPESREAVALRFFADLSLEDIASAQQVPLGTVKSRLHTALARLRRALAEAGYERASVTTTERDDHRA